MFGNANSPDAPAVAEDTTAELRAGLVLSTSSATLAPDGDEPVIVPETLPGSPPSWTFMAVKACPEPRLTTLAPSCVVLLGYQT
jgi:hypothetical protein